MAIVKMYGTEICPWCIKAREFLKTKKIKFSDIDVGDNEKARIEMVEKSGQLSVPQIEINGKVIIGFDKEAIETEIENV